jgi:hypothetical protein
MMSVVRGGKAVFCEGKQSSLDYRLLHEIIRLAGEHVSIVPAGSKFTFSIFVDGYFSSNTAQKYMIFRDRDFDIQPTESVQLLQLGKMSLTHSACVENYLLDAVLIDSYWKDNYKKKQEERRSSKWGHGDSPGIQTISDWIEKSAESLKDYQAVRWALGDLSQISGARSQIKTTWTGGSGNLPASLDLQSCKTNALTLVNDFRSDLQTITQEKFEESLDKYKARFDQPEFWANKKYLIWFHGKDIQKEMQRQKQNYISLEDFFDWAIPELEIDRYPDFIALQKKIKEL